MSEIIHVQHPAPVRYVPKGGRIERAIAAAVVTPVALTRIEERDVERVPGFEEGRFLYLHDGRPWIDLLDGGLRVAPEGLAHFLRERWLFHPFLVAFNATPLCAMAPEQVSTGIPFDPATAREVREDGRERAAADVQSFFDAEVRVCPGRVLVRARPVAVYDVENCTAHTSGMFQGTLTPRSNRWSGLVCHLDRIGEVREFSRRMEHPIHHLTDRAGAGAAYDAIPRGVLPADDDVRITVNLLARRATELIREAVCARGVAPAFLEAAEPARAALRPYWFSATTGMLGPEDFEAVVSAARLAKRALADAQSLGIRGLDGFNALVGYADTVMLPRVLAGHVPEADDLDALTGLAPGAFR